MRYPLNLRDKAARWMGKLLDNEETILNLYIKCHVSQNVLYKTGIK